MPSSLISIIIPTYNRAALIGESIQSVLNQTYKHWELIIIDDGSHDDTHQVVSNFRDKRISYYSIAHCGIFGKVRNEGLRRANGEYVAFLDSDDLWCADKLETQLELMNQYPEIFFVFSNVTIFGSRAFVSPQTTMSCLLEVFCSPCWKKHVLFFIRQRFFLREKP